MNKCRYCDEPIRWAKTEANGRPMPINVGPDPNGNLVITRIVGDVPMVRVLTREEQTGSLLASENADPRYMPHKATCVPKPGRDPQAHRPKGMRR